jgi:hypothetical protein
MSKRKTNLSERSEDKLRASPERSEGEDQFSVACEGKLENRRTYRSPTMIVANVTCEGKNE